MTLKLFCIGLIGLFSLTLSAQIYVGPDGSGSGKSWSFPSNLQDALQRAEYGDVLWLKSGVYTPIKCVICSEDDRAYSFEIPDGVHIYGGFDGTENELSERNFKLNKTILSGDINSDGLPLSNSFTVVKTFEVSEATLIDGLTITGGVAIGSADVFEYPALSGGGWYNGSLGTQQSNPRIINCTFENNFAKYFGGGLYNMAAFEGQCNPVLESCVFFENRAEHDGGAVYNNGAFQGVCNPQFFNCRFEKNLAGKEINTGSGGAIFNNGIQGVCNPKIVNCAFSYQVATLHGGALYNHGKSGQSSPEIINSIFNSNDAIQGGAIYNLGSNFDGSSSPKIYNCSFYKNRATDYGGAIVCNGDLNGSSEPKIFNSIFWENVGGIDGNVFYKINGHPDLHYCLIDVEDCEELYSAYGLGSQVNCHEGMIYGDCLRPFKQPELGNFSLMYNSEAINAGVNLYLDSIPYDYYGDARVVGSRVDIGATEYHGKGPTIIDSFEIILFDQFVFLQWRTLEEFRLTGFDIERGVEEDDFNTIAHIPAKGDTLGRRTYLFHDFNPVPGKNNSYRIKSIDEDGCHKYSDVESVEIEVDSIIMNLFPNPAETFTKLDVYLPDGSAVALFKITNAVGQTLLEASKQLPEGWSETKFEIDNISSTGTHYLQIIFEKSTFVLPFVVMRN